MGIRARHLVVGALALASCHRDLRPENRGERWAIVCPLAGETPPQLVADFSSWTPIEATAERIDEGWRLAFRPPAAPGLYRLQCRGANQAAPPAGFDWLEDDGFGGQNAIWLFHQVTGAPDER